MKLREKKLKKERNRGLRPAPVRRVSAPRLRASARAWEGSRPAAPVLEPEEEEVETATASVVVPEDAETEELEREALDRQRNGSTEMSPLQLYLREVGQVKLLTAAEEIALAKRIRKGDDHAREHMIKANLRLVVKIARDYENLGLPLLDLINEGNMGLMKGVERFDPAKGAKLSTYASWWIKQSIKRALANQSKTIRLPVHVVDKVAHIRRAELKLKEVLDREPTDEELAVEVQLKPQRVKEYRAAARAPVSLDAPLGGEEDSDRVSEVVADTRAEAPFERLANSSDAALMRDAFATLKEREQEILRLRFGLENDAPMTLEKIGQRYGLTRERIRQIEAEGLKKLRSKMAKRDRLAVEGIKSLAA
jgi:RNA polymerase primary sigma factor